MSDRIDLVDFLLARLNEDEKWAQNCAQAFPPPWEVVDRGWVAYVRANEPDFREVARLEDQSVAGGDVWLGDRLWHVARWSPTRVLAEVAAKRDVVELLGVAERLLAETRRTAPEYRYVAEAEGPRNALLRAVQHLALPYADHPDYDDAWRP